MIIEDLPDLPVVDTEASLVYEIEWNRNEIARSEAYISQCDGRQRNAALRLREMLRTPYSENAEIHGHDRKLVVIDPDGRCLFSDVEYQGGDF